MSIVKSKKDASDESEALQTIWDILSQGRSDSDTAELMGLDAETYNILKEKLLDNKTNELRKRPIEHVFVEYMLNQIGNIGELTGLIRRAKKDKQYNSAISAIKVRADLQDRVLEKGMELGVLKKGVAAGQDLARFVADMTADDIRLTFVRAISEMGKMMKTFGEHDIIDATPGELHYGEPLAEDEGHGATGASEVVAPPSKEDIPTSSAKGKAKMSKSTKAIRGRKSMTVR